MWLNPHVNSSIPGGRAFHTGAHRPAFTSVSKPTADKQQQSSDTIQIETHDNTTAEQQQKARSSRAVCSFVLQSARARRRSNAREAHTPSIPASPSLAARSGRQRDVHATRPKPKPRRQRRPGSARTMGSAVTEVAALALQQCSRSPSLLSGESTHPDAARCASVEGVEERVGRCRVSSSRRRLVATRELERVDRARFNKHI